MAVSQSKKVEEFRYLGSVVVQNNEDIEADVTHSELGQAGQSEGRPVRSFVAYEYS